MFSVDVTREDHFYLTSYNCRKNNKSQSVKNCYRRILGGCYRRKRTFQKQQQINLPYIMLKTIHYINYSIY